MSGGSYPPPPQVGTRITLQAGVSQLENLLPGLVVNSKAISSFTYSTWRSLLPLRAIRGNRLDISLFLRILLKWEHQGYKLENGKDVLAEIPQRVGKLHALHTYMLLFPLLRSTKENAY